MSDKQQERTDMTPDERVEEALYQLDMVSMEAENAEHTYAYQIAVLALDDLLREVR